MRPWTEEENGQAVVYSRNVSRSSSWIEVENTVRYDGVASLAAGYVR